jgi:hypothetical protein
MKKNDGFFEHGEKTEEDLLDFKFDDLSYDDTTGTSGPNEIIELVDVVEQGDFLDDLELDDISIALDEDELTEKKPAERDLDRDLDEADLDFDLNDSYLESLAEVESEGDIVLEDLTEGDEEASALAGDELIEKYLDKEEAETEHALDAGLDPFVLHTDSSQRPYEEVVMEPAVSNLEAQPDAGHGEKVSIGVSEERMEAIIREVIEDVVERVARETMANVAERVIGEAIEALKQSLEDRSR